MLDNVYPFLGKYPNKPTKLTNHTQLTRKLGNSKTCQLENHYQTNYYSNTFFNKSVTLAAGSFLIFISSCATV